MFDKKVEFTPEEQEEINKFKNEQEEKLKKKKRRELVDKEKAKIEKEYKEGQKTDLEKAGNTLKNTMNGAVKILDNLADNFNKNGGIKI